MIYHHYTGTNSIEIAQGVDILTMGITPSGSGKLHIGHHLTMFNMLRALANTHGDGLIFVDDREFSLQITPRIPDEVTIKTTIESIRQMIDEVSQFLSIDLNKRVQIDRMSTFFGSRGIDSEFMGQDLFSILIKYANHIGKIFHKLKLSGINSVVPICPECGEGSLKRFRDSGKKITQTSIQDRCDNPKCKNTDYKVKVDRGENNWVIFYTFVSLINILIARQKNKSILEFFGGDYGLPWGKNPNKTIHQAGMSKAERISEMITVMNMREQVHQIVGPLVTLHGKKCSKSEGHMSEIIDCRALEQMLDNRSPNIDCGQL